MKSEEQSMKDVIDSIIFICQFHGDSVNSIERNRVTGEVIAKWKDDSVEMDIFTARSLTHLYDKVKEFYGVTNKSVWGW